MPSVPRDRPGRGDPERDSFEDAMADVTPIDRRKSRLVAPPPPPRPRAAATAAAVPAVASPRLTALPRPGDGFAFAADGVDRRVLKELEGGLRPVEATLDLHGRKSREADAALTAFVRGAQAGGRRVLLVVHGRGLGSGRDGPVLRQLVLERLTSSSLALGILAVVSAPPRQGGTGASLVLLRRS